MQTYAETKGVKPFDWKIELEKCIETKLESTYNLTIEANRWITCACGNQCDIIPREKNGAPKDEFLASEGVDFYNYVSLGLWGKALETLDKIEQRSNELIKEINT